MRLIIGLLLLLTVTCILDDTYVPRVMTSDDIEGTWIVVEAKSVSPSVYVFDTITWEINKTGYHDYDSIFYIRTCKFCIPNYIDNVVGYIEGRGTDSLVYEGLVFRRTALDTLYIKYTGIWEITKRFP